VPSASPGYCQAQLYRGVAGYPRLDLTAIFVSNAGIRPDDFGYGRDATWDVDRLAGYRGTFLRHSAPNPSAESTWDLRDTDIGRLLRGRYQVLWSHGCHHLTHPLAVATQRVRRQGVIFRQEQILLYRCPPLKALAKRVLLRLGRSERCKLYRHGERALVRRSSAFWVASATRRDTADFEVERAFCSTSTPAGSRGARVAARGYAAEHALRRRRARARG